MAPRAKVVHAPDVAVERMQEKDGWAISEFRLPISGRDGSATTLFHSIFRPGSTHAKHVHTRCDEFVAYVDGRGLIGQSHGRAEVTPGHRRRIPQGTEHFLHNESAGQSLVIGFYVGAGSVAESGYEHRGDVTKADIERPWPDVDEGVLVQLADTPRAELSGLDAWSQAEVHVSVGSQTGCPNALLDVVLPAGARLGAHRLRACEQLYYVIAGEGELRAGGKRHSVRRGDVVFLPAGEVSAWASHSNGEELWLVGVLTGAGSLQESGYEAA
jgi:quercetin dioxygenase-like cupin family protein